MDANTAPKEATAMRASDRSIAPSSEFDILVCRYWYRPDYGRPRMRMSLATSRSVTTLTTFGDDVVPNTNEITDLEWPRRECPIMLPMPTKRSCDSTSSY